MSFKLGVIGTGYVGLVSGTCFAATGNTVFCVDIDEEKINKLSSGICTIFEPGLDRLLERNLKEERLIFSTDLNIAVENANIIFLCLPTPPSEDGSADLHHVLECAADIAKIIIKKNIKERKIIVNKSTVPVGTASKVAEIFASYGLSEQIDVISNPEFLREGFAVDDAMKPERIVIGTSSKFAEKLMRDLYEPFVRSGNPIYVMDEKSSEVTKYAANSFLAVKISFMNDLSAYCEVSGADIEKVRLGIGSDTRIGKRFLFAGIGYGGSCFPKDVRALIYSAEQEGIGLKVVTAAQEVNYLQVDRFIDKLLKKFGSLNNLKFGLWGLAFKPNTDDIREAPAYKLIDRILAEGGKISAYDPEAMLNTEKIYGDKVEYSVNMYQCLSGSDALIIATEWTVFRNPDFGKVKDTLKSPVIFDGRNLFDPEDMSKLGFEYYCIGRGSAKE